LISTRRGPCVRSVPEHLRTGIIGYTADVFDKICLQTGVGHDVIPVPRWNETCHVCWIKHAACAVRLVTCECNRDGVGAILPCPGHGQIGQYCNNPDTGDHDADDTVSHKLSPSKEGSAKSEEPKRRDPHAVRLFSFPWVRSSRGARTERRGDVRPARICRAA